MDTEKQTLEEKCEYLMNIVVESRKHFGKMCKDYEEKTFLVENKMLKHQLKTIGKRRFKPKNHIPEMNIEEMEKELDDFTFEILETQKRIDVLSQNVLDTRTIVLQLKEDTIGKKLRKQITADALLAEAKSKINKL